MENQKFCKIAASRRRLNLFKKAEELATLCGARVAVVIISKKGKIWLFPGSEVVIDIYTKYKESSIPNTRLIISRRTEGTEHEEEDDVIERRSDLESSIPDPRSILLRKRKSIKRIKDVGVIKRTKELSNLVSTEEILHQSWMDLTLSLAMPYQGMN